MRRDRSDTRTSNMGGTSITTDYVIASAILEPVCIPGVTAADIGLTVNYRLHWVLLSLYPLLADQASGQDCAKLEFE